MEDENAFWVRGFPEDAPATPGALLAFDGAHGLGKVTHDQATDTTRLAAALWIGDNENAGTFFRVGSTEHPRQHLAVLGTVWVRPPRASVRRSDGRRAIVNRLTIGDPENPDIRAGRLRVDDLLATIYKRARVWISDVVLGGRERVLRACITSFRTDETDLACLVEELERARR